MVNFLKLLLARRMIRTPLGLAALAAGWLLGRRRRQRRRQQADPSRRPQNTPEHPTALW
ncbi:DUF6203 family protein [Spongiactinospora gelatinilytica]|uniref:DUF6203 family protein n=1 Tax=Spongiactinospora gelatinilytica TaxID=2666298 RepID=UPI0013144901|nr:DUF6203 family protein [Spongiactinospora gelatinilytica]